MSTVNHLYSFHSLPRLAVNKHSAAYGIPNNPIRRGGSNSKSKSGPAFRKNRAKRGGKV